MSAIVQALKEAGFDEIRAVPVSAVLDYPNIYWEREAQNQLTGLEPDYRNKQGLLQYLEGYESILGVTVPYALLPECRVAEEKHISRVSIMAWAWDYHKVIENRIREALQNFDGYKIHVDSGPLPERSLALKMGLAKRGRSQMLLHDRYGSSFYLAFILVKEALDLSPKCEGKDAQIALAAICLNCRKCQAHCPSGALTMESDFDGKKCISAITQKKGVLSEVEKRSIGLQLYGCDHCQLSCPANSPLFKTQLNRDNIILKSKTHNALDPSEILTYTQRTFKEVYSTAGFTWRGARVSKRNALINMANSQNGHWLAVVEAFIHTLEKSSERDEGLYETAQWAAEILRKV